MTVPPWVWDVMAELARYQHVPECRIALAQAPQNVRESATTFAKANASNIARKGSDPVRRFAGPLDV